LHEVTGFKAEDGVIALFTKQPYECLELLAVYTLVVGLENRRIKPGVAEQC